MIDLQNSATYYIIQGAFIGLVWLAVLDFIMGLGLILIPQQIFQANDALKKWITLRQQFKYFNHVFRIEPFIYRYPHSFGIILTLYALIAIYVLMFMFNLEDVVTAYSVYSGLNGSTVEYIAHGLYLIFLVFSIAGVIVGVMLMTTPHQMQAVDHKLNTWVSVRSALKLVESMNEGPDRFIKRHPRLIGTLVCLACLYFFVTIFYFNWFIYLKF